MDKNIYMGPIYLLLYNKAFAHLYILYVSYSWPNDWTKLAEFF